jgi:mono/diheme cytochrome c family protein
MADEAVAMTMLIRFPMFGVLVVLAGCGASDETTLTGASGKDLFQDYCVGCHGTSGRGDGPDAAGVGVPVADLTTLAARNGGEFPYVRVMGQIYGYSLGTGPTGPMPEFGPLLEGETVLIETEPGVMTPTPERLVRLAEYVRSLNP